MLSEAYQRVATLQLV